MTQVLIQNLDHPQSTPVKAQYCQSFLCQLRGLTFRRALEPDEGLLLVQKQDSIINASIHMFFMRIQIGVIWINQENIIVDARLAKPWIPAYFPAQPARYILETHPQRLRDFHVKDHIQIISASDPYSAAY